MLIYIFSFHPHKRDIKTGVLVVDEMTVIVVGLRIGLFIVFGFAMDGGACDDGVVEGKYVFLLSFLPIFGPELHVVGHSLVVHFSLNYFQDKYIYYQIDGCCFDNDKKCRAGINFFVHSLMFSCLIPSFILLHLSFLLGQQSTAMFRCLIRRE